MLNSSPCQSWTMSACVRLTDITVFTELDRCVKFHVEKLPIAGVCIMTLSSLKEHIQMSWLFILCFHFISKKTNGLRISHLYNREGKGSFKYNAVCFLIPFVFPKVNAKQLNFLKLYFYKTGGNQRT